MRCSRGLAGGLALVAGCAMGQPATDPADMPTPPPLSTHNLVMLDVTGSALSFGIDPASVSVREDRIVRYVVVARSTTGALNALFEGLRCETGEVRVYARHSGRGQWEPVRGAEWRSLFDDRGARHTLAFARAGACMGQAPAGTPEQILRNVALPMAQRFR